MCAPFNLHLPYKAAESRDPPTLNKRSSEVKWCMYRLMSPELKGWGTRHEDIASLGSLDAIRFETASKVTSIGTMKEDTGKRNWKGH